MGDLDETLLLVHAVGYVLEGIAVLRLTCQAVSSVSTKHLMSFWSKAVG